MKTNRNANNARKGHLFLVSTLTAAISSVISAPAYAAALQSPFEAVPAWLEQSVDKKSNSETSVTTTQTTYTPYTKTQTTKKTVYGAPNVKPRIMLLFDDSGSMTKKNSKGETRMWRLKNAMNTLLSEPGKYSDKAKWNMISLHGTAVNKAVNIYDRVYGDSFMSGKSLYREYINKLSPTGITSTTAIYVTAADALYKDIKYSCQKNYIIVLSDGDANFDGFEQ